MTARSGAADTRKAGGYTVLELLVAVLIASVLATLAVGGLRWARTRGGIAASMGNLRMLVVANGAYAQDHSGYYCPAQEPGNLVRWHGGRDSIDDEFEQGRGFLGPYLGDDGRIGFCPLLSREVDSPDSWERGAGGYGYNAFYIGGRPGHPERTAHVTETAVGGRTLMFATTAIAKDTGLQEYPFAEPFFWPRSEQDREGGGRMQPSVHFRAGGKAIVAWANGRVTLEPPSEFSDINFYGGDNRRHRIGWLGPMDQNGYWNPASPAVRGLAMDSGEPVAEP